MDDKEHSYHDFNREELTVLPKVFWGTVITVVAVFLWSIPKLVHASPLAQTVTAEGARIVVTDEECQLKEVTNLKYRVVWHEKGKVYEGCYAVHPYGLVVAYFSDKTVAVMPLDAFTKVTGA